MRIVRFLSAAGPRLGLVRGDEVVDLVAAAEERGMSWLVPLFSDLRLFVSGGEGSRAAADSVAQFSRLSRSPLASLKLLAPFHTGSKILAHVVNYRGHDKEAGVKIPSRPFFFIKIDGCASNPDDPLIAHRWSRKVDHEVEVGVVIGKTGRNISAREALAHVAGYLIVNDVSYRDLQFNEGGDDLSKSYGKNWTQGKGLDLSCPMGPFLVLTDEMPEPYPLELTCRVNGVVRQHANTQEMVYKVAALVEEASKGMTLYPGDIISSGTCAGGGLSDGHYLQPGDLVECEIERLGVLRNTVMAEPDAR